LKEKKTRLKEAIANKEEEEYSGEWDIDVDTKFKAVADLLGCSKTQRSYGETHLKHCTYHHLRK
jgi:hypothetical protein